MNSRNIVLVGMVMVGLAAFADKPEPSPFSRWFPCYGTSFDKFDVGTQLSDAMITRGGTWGSPAVPRYATAKVIEESGIRYLEFDTSKAFSDITFTAAKRYPGSKYTHRFVTRFADADEFPEMGAEDKTSFLAVRDAGGVARFVGYTRQGWTNLVSAAVGTPVFDRWYDCALKFEAKGDKLFVTYLVRPYGDGAEYATLASADGETSFETAGSGTSVTGFDLCGSGEVMYMDGVVNRHGLSIMSR